MKLNSNIISKLPMAGISLQLTLYTVRHLNPSLLKRFDTSGFKIIVQFTCIYHELQFSTAENTASLTSLYQQIFKEPIQNN